MRYSTRLLPMLLTLAACDQPALTAPVMRQTEVPISSDYRASGTIGSAPRCEALGLLYVSLAGGGIESHIGRYTISNSHCLNPATGEFTAGLFTKITASGDELRGTYHGTSSVVQAPAPVGIFAVEGRLEFDGGTGRFAGAAGSQSMRGTLTSDFSQANVPTTAELHLMGTISTVGSAQ